MANYKLATFFLVLLFVYACSNSKVESNEEDEELGETEIVLEDTLKLNQGVIPEKWNRTDLGGGYYIGFPKRPRTRERDAMTEWKLVRDKYELFVSVADLTAEPSFEDNKQYREAYYHAIVNDLADGIDGEPGDGTNFLSLDIYEGLETTIFADDVTLFVRCIIIGTDLFTMSMILYEEEIPVYYQLRQKFFASFGKELNILDQSF